MPCAVAIALTVIRRWTDDPALASVVSDIRGRNQGGRRRGYRQGREFLENANVCQFQPSKV